MIWRDYFSRYLDPRGDFPVFLPIAIYLFAVATAISFGLFIYGGVGQ